MHPHQTRHWFVTMALRKIKKLPQEDQDEARGALIAYMGWKNPQTIAAYDHRLRTTDFGPTHAAVAKLVQSGAEVSATADVVEAVPLAPPQSARAVPAWVWQDMVAEVDALLDGNKEVA